MKLYQYTIEDMTGLANQVREILAANLFAEGLIDTETARKVTEEYALLIVPRGLLGETIDKILGVKDEPVFQMVKLVPQQKTRKQNDNQPEGSN